MDYTATNPAAPKLEGQALRRYTSKNIKENIFQNIIALPNLGVTEKFSEDTNASEIRIIREIEPTGDAREYGGEVNGGWYDSNDVDTPKSAEYALKVLFTYDRPVDLPTVMDDMVEVEVAESVTKNLGGKVSRLVNASTIAVQMGNVINSKIKGVQTNEVVLVGNNIKNAIIMAGAKLDNGDTSVGIDMYPENQRQVFIRPEAYGDLMMSESGVIVGGSNYAQQMLAKGTISPDTYVDNGSGYCGELLGMPVYKVGNPIWKEAERWMGLAPGKLDTVKAIVVSGLATARGLAFNHSVKIVDTQNGQGKRIQPLYRWGVEVLSQSGIVPILEEGTTLIGGTGITESNPIKVVAPGSKRG